jgi:hypothetical protein
MANMRFLEAALSFNPSTAVIAANVLSPNTREDALIGDSLRFSTIPNPTTNQVTGDRKKYSLFDRETKRPEQQLRVLAVRMGLANRQEG